MENGLADPGFINAWIWVILVAAGLLLIIVELLLGVDTGLDLVFIGSAFIIGGLVAIPLQSWVWAVIAVAVICLVYFAVGRRYVHRNMGTADSKTNIDTIIGQSGIVEKEISRAARGLVKVGNEQWQARADETIGEGEEIIVTGISGITLDVKKAEGGNR